MSQWVFRPMLAGWKDARWPPATRFRKSRVRAEVTSSYGEHLKCTPPVNARGMKRVPPNASPKAGNMSLPDGTAESLGCSCALKLESPFSAPIRWNCTPPEGFCATKAAFAVANTERFRAALDSEVSEL